MRWLGCVGDGDLEESLFDHDSLGRDEGFLRVLALERKEDLTRDEYLIRAIFVLLRRAAFGIWLYGSAKYIAGNMRENYKQRKWLR